MNVGIVVDNPIRDLPGCILLASKLIKQDVKVFLIPMYQQKFDVTLLKLDAIILNYARLNNFKLIRKYKESGIKVYILDTEGGVVSSHGADSIENWPKLLKENGIAEWLDGYFFWGPLMSDSFERDSGIEKERLHLTGNPRFDFCHPTWNSILYRENQDYILINTNFSAINPKYSSSSESELQAFRSAGWTNKYIEKLMDEVKKSFTDFLSTIEKLVQINPHLKFIIRPHPFESKELYIRKFSEFRNCEITQNESIFAAIANSACIIHLNCGTAVESIQLNKIPISLDFLNTDFLAEHTPLPSKISYNVHSFSDLNHLINNINSANEDFDFSQKYNEFIFPMFYQNDGNAAQRIANVINVEGKLGLKKFNHLRERFRENRSLRSFFASLESILYFVIGSKLGSDIRNLFEKRRLGKSIIRQDVQEQFNIFHKETGENMKLKVEYASNPYTKMPLTSIKCEKRRI